MAKVVLLEFNEICPPLLDKWMAQGLLPNFKRFFEGSEVFTTVADELDPVKLEPWIQWYSVHTGLPYREHRVFRLTDGPRAGHEDIWRHLRGLGKNVMNCSSMNARSFAGERSFFLPDPWCTGEPAWPRELDIFKQVVSRMVQEYSRDAAVLSAKEIAAFLSFLARHGLTAATTSAILAQLAAERLSARDVKWKRAALLDRLQYDIFQHYYRALRPDFATFFINSTAHLQHSYWRHMDPEPFSVKPSKEERETYGASILYGYQAMDRLLRDFAQLVDGDTVPILCSALSQQPFLRREADGGQHFYRLRDPNSFLAGLGIEPELIEPVMTHQYQLRFRSAADVAAAAASLTALTLEGGQAFAAVPSDNNSLYIGCQLFKPVARDAVIEGFRGANAPARFFELLYPIEALKSGCHHPEGVLWIRTGGHAVHREKVSILDIAPTVCELVDVRADVGGRRCGESLVARFAGPRAAERAVA